MIKLLLVGDGRSIFFVNYVKALKRNLDVEVTVYSPFPQNDWYKEYPYDTCFFENSPKIDITRMKFFGAILQPYITRYKFGKFLKRNQVHYDIIHFHWILAAWVIKPFIFKHYCKFLGVSLWGGELESLVLLRSHRYYLKNLGNLFTIADFGIGSTAISNPKVMIEFPQLSGKCYFGIYGSSVISEMQSINAYKVEFMRKNNIPDDKIKVMLGYSGKEIHQHIRILEEIQSRMSFRDYMKRIHFLVPMTRGATKDYIVDVENELKRTKCSYTLFANGYMSDKDVAALRSVTQILFQLTKFDEVSASIIEALSSGSIMIAGNWYPNYDILRKYGFKWEEVESISESVDVFYRILPNLQSYEQTINNNISRGKERFSWDYCIRDWVKAYEKLMKKL